MGDVSVVTGDVNASPRFLDAPTPGRPVGGRFRMTFGRFRMTFGRLRMTFGRFQPTSSCHQLKLVENVQPSLSSSRLQPGLESKRLNPAESPAEAGSLVV